MARKRKSSKKARKQVRRTIRKQVRRTIKRAARDGKITKRESKSIRKIAKKTGVSSKSLKKQYARATKGKKNLKLSRHAKKKLLGKIRNSGGKGKGGGNKGNRSNRTIQGNKSIKSKKDKFKKIDEIEELEDILEEDFEVVEDDNISGKKWSPGKVEDHVAQQWGKRFQDKKNFKPKRLKIDGISTPDRIRKYTDKKTGEFDSQKYVSDVRSKMAQRAEKRGLRGNALNALKRKGPQMPKESKPKYGGAIENLKNKLGGINYRQEINRTTKKLTGNVKIKSREFQKVGLDIIKPRRSEDRAVPTAGLKDRDARKQRRRKRREERRKKRLAAQTTTKSNDSTSTV